MPQNSEWPVESAKISINNKNYHIAPNSGQQKFTHSSLSENTFLQGKLPIGPA